MDNCVIQLGHHTLNSDQIYAQAIASDKLKAINTLHTLLLTFLQLTAAARPKSRGYFYHSFWCCDHAHDPIDVVIMPASTAAVSYVMPALNS